MNSSSSAFVQPDQIWPMRRARPTLRAATAPDATLAVSQAALTKLVQQAIDKPIQSSSSGSWGPFFAGYDVNLSVSGGNITLIELDNQISLDQVIVAGTVSLTLGLNLGNVLPQICIPPVQLCVGTPWGNVCTPQACVTWPSISVTVPIPVLPIGLSAVFQLVAQQDGANWDVIAKIFPFSIQIDFTPTVNTIINSVEDVVNNTLGAIPLIGGLIAGLIDTVLNILRGVIDAILQSIADFIKALIILIDVFSPTIPFKITSFPARQTFIPAGSAGDGEVDLVISAVAATIPPPDPGTLLSPEIIVAIDFT